MPREPGHTQMAEGNYDGHYFRLIVDFPLHVHVGVERIVLTADKRHNQRLIRASFLRGNAEPLQRVRAKRLHDGVVPALAVDALVLGDRAAAARRVEHSVAKTYSLFAFRDLRIAPLVERRHELAIRHHGIPKLRGDIRR